LAAALLVGLVSAVVAVAPAAQAVAGSGSARRVRSSTPTQGLVDLAFIDFLDRYPSEYSLGKWTTLLDSGMTQAEFVAGLAATPDVTSEQVRRLYHLILDREPSGPALDNWASQVRSGRLTVAGVAARFLATNEYFQMAGGTNPWWVWNIYKYFLGVQSPSPSRVTSWAAKVPTVGRLAVAAQLWQSSLGRGLRVGQLYWRLLRRSPVAGVSLDHWLAVDASRAGDLAVVVGLASGAEYAWKATGTLGLPPLPAVLHLSAQVGVPFSRTVVCFPPLSSSGGPPCSTAYSLASYAERPDVGIGYSGSNPADGALVVSGTPTTAGTFRVGLTVGDGVLPGMGHEELVLVIVTVTA
jgi:hypothetical protein